MKRLIFAIVISLSALMSCGFILIKMMAGAPEAVPPVIEYQQDARLPHPPDSNQTVFSVLSLNLAHGRQDKYHQALLTTPEIRSNLDDIISLLKGKHPDFVALQEADGPSIWSGRFSHVAYIANRGGYSHSVRGTHVQGLGLTYGTAILSRTLLYDPQSITFNPSPPTLTKGFTVATIKLDTDMEIDLVSVHLDFFSKKVRQRQIQLMVKQLAKRHKPLIIMGDFNAEWRENSAPQFLSKELKLTTYQPENTKFITFPALQKRIDYILISAELEFISYTVLKDTVSDHRAILATIKLSNKVDQYHAP